jgi:hypothetical protein
MHCDVVLFMSQYLTPTSLVVLLFSYVDSSRMISVELGGEGDLKSKMNEKANMWGGAFGRNAETHDYNVVKMTEHYMKRGNFASALGLISDIVKNPLASTVSVA